MRFVLDSSAILALLWQEKGAESILRHTGIYITPSLIYAETCIRLMKEGTKRLEAEPIANTVIDEVLPLEKEDTALILKFAFLKTPVVYIPIFHLNSSHSIKYTLLFIINEILHQSFH